MNHDEKLQKIEAYFDREFEHAEGAEAFLNDPEVEEHLAFLKRMRAGVEAVSEPVEITDGQFNSFMAGIREGVDEAPASVWGAAFWAKLSLVAAALIISVSAFYVFSDGPQQTLATEVELVSTDLEGASVDWSASEDGVTTVWVTTNENDVW